MFLFGDGVRLTAEWRVGVLPGVFMLVRGPLAALVFVYRAQEAKYAWPVSIVDYGVPVSACDRLAPRTSKKFAETT